MTGPEVLIWWIDDDIEHKQDAFNLGKSAAGMRVVFLEPQQAFDRLSTLGESDVPSLFLVDFYLNRKGRFGERGLTMEGKIRENYPDLPIYAFTADPDLLGGIFRELRQPAETRFDRIMLFKEVQRQGEGIYRDAVTYSKIRATKGKGLQPLLELIGVPDDVRERLTLTLPEELRSGLALEGEGRRGGDSIAFARWLRGKLMAIPGFVYNEFRVATHLGVTSAGFRSVSQRFDKARYVGVFHETAEPLWWVSKVDEILFSLEGAKNMEVKEPWEVAPEILGIPETQRTKCVVCGKGYPETVGTDVDDELNEQPVHFRCSTVDRNRKAELFFDEPHAFKREAKSDAV